MLDRMSGLVKSDDEEEMARQEQLVLEGKAMFRTTVMFTATMPAAVERLAKDYMRCPAIVAIGDQESGKNKRIVQEVYFMSEGQKQRRVLDLLRSADPPGPIIVFVNIKKNCDVLCKALLREGINACVLHGGKSQDQREVCLCYARSLALVPLSLLVCLQTPSAPLLLLLPCVCRTPWSASRMVTLTCWWPPTLLVAVWILRTCPWSSTTTCRRLTGRLAGPLPCAPQCLQPVVSCPAPLTRSISFPTLLCARVFLSGD